MTPDERLERLDDLVGVGALAPMDRHVVTVLDRLAPGAHPDALVAVAFASRALADGDTCVDLARRSAEPLEDARGELVPGWVFPDADAWWSAVEAAPFVAGDGATAPVVAEAGRVWLARYRGHEEALAARLAARLATAVPPVDDALLDVSIRRLFPGEWQNDEQEAAVRHAATHGLTVLAGGPGTGKTTTVVRILAALAEQAAARGAALPRVLLLAPTGKAAARLGESVAEKIDELDLDPRFADDVRAALPRTAGTIHRALRPTNAWLSRFRHGEDDPWPADVVVVDEASMVDLPLMSSLVAALKPQARLVLVGDPRQLAAVGVGAVLADLAAQDAPLTVRDAVAWLRESRRFSPDGGIGRLAAALDDRDGDAALAALAEEDELTLWDTPVAVELAAVRDAVVAGFRPVGEAPDGPAKLAALERFRVLCATRVGPCGVEAVNGRIARWLRRAGVLAAGEQVAGWPVLVTTNDRDAQLYNGDLGVFAPDADGRMKVWFQGPDGVRAIAPSRLPAHEPAFAMTVHKSQGSEVDEVLLLLPPRPVRVLSRELLYTGVTRARSRVRVAGLPSVLEAGLSRDASRTGGLRDALAALDTPR